MKLFIQNMVSYCCKKVVAQELNKLNLKYSSIDLGEVELIEPINPELRVKLKIKLHEYGMELMDNEKGALVEMISCIIIDMIHNDNRSIPEENFSVYLSKQLNMNYRYLSELFAKTKGVTIEHYVILHKIERVKELIMYDELNISEISYRLNYSSVAHLSNQFKKVAGLSPSFFKKLKNKKRSTLENI